LHLPARATARVRPYILRRYIETLYTHFLLCASTHQSRPLRSSAALVRRDFTVNVAWLYLKFLPETSEVLLDELSCQRYNCDTLLTGSHLMYSCCIYGQPLLIQDIQSLLSGQLCIAVIAPDGVLALVQPSIPDVIVSVFPKSFCSLNENEYNLCQ